MDSILQSEVKCGCFQVVFVFLTQMARFSTVWGLYIMMFGNYEPPWRCILDDNDHDRNITGEFLLPNGNWSQAYYLSLNHSSSSSSSYGFVGDHNNNNNTNGNVSFSNTNASSSSSSATIHGSCHMYPSCKRIEFESDSSTIVTEFELICDKAWKASFTISVELFAVVPGAYIGGQIGERFGRKISLYGSNALMAVSLVVAIFSVNWEMYTVVSAFIGLGGGGILSTCVVFTMEFLNPWWRAMFASVPVWNASLAIFTLVIVWLRDWRLIHVTSACMSGLSVLGAIWVPESVRWLEVHGKRKKAVEVVKRMYKTNKLKLSATHSMESDAEAEAAVDNKDDDEEIQYRKDRHKTYLDLFRDPHIRSITLRAAVAWLCTLIAYLAMGYGVKSLAGDYYVNVIIASVSEVPIMLFIGPVSNKVGRRWSVTSFLSLAASACGAIVVVHFTVDGETRGLAIKILALVAKAFAAAAWCVLATMSVELFPTVVRNLGYGFLTLVSRSGGIIAPYLIPQDPGAFAACFSAMTVALIISIVMALSLPETKDRPLTDVVEEPRRRDSSSNL